MNLRPLLVGSCLFFAAAAALACAPAPPRGQYVDIGDESAIILWDAAARTEHFVRRATFATPAKDFGFLVPTPTKPTLAESGDEVFRHLADVTAPRIVTKAVYEPSFGIGCGSGRRVSDAPAASVQVLEQTRVGGYDASVLAADDPAALNRWLGEHGYESRPALTAWLAPYTKAGWTVTAFKIAKAVADAPNVGTTAVRMTFQTNRPFFPYREPEDQRGAKANPPRRLLRVYFIGDGRFAGALDGGADWPGRAVWANAVSETNRIWLANELRLPIPAGNSLWLTEFEDHSSPRPGTDEVYFAPSADQTPIERHPIIRNDIYTFPDLISLSILLAITLSLVTLVVRRVLRR